MAVNKGCLSQEVMMRYLRKELSQEEFTAAEEHMSGCEFCRESLEGIQSYLENYSQEKLESTLTAVSFDLTKRFTKDTNVPSKGKTFPWRPFIWGTLSLIVIIIITLFFILTEKTQEASINEKKSPAGKPFQSNTDTSKEIGPQKEVSKAGKIPQEKKEILKNDIRRNSEREKTNNTGNQEAPAQAGMKIEEAKDHVIQQEAPREIFTVVEEQPAYPGGDEARIKFLQDHIKYPQEAIELKVSGKVFVTFVVEEDGSLSDLKILRGLGAGCDEEAIRVVKSMPKWIPGKQRGVPVRVQYVLPVKFTLL